LLGSLDDGFFIWVMTEKRMRFLFTITCFFILSSVANAVQFEPGQVWKYKTRPQERRSTLTVVRVDKIGDTRVIHVSLVGLKMKNPRKEEGVSETVSDLPISREALQQSVTDLVGVSDTLPDYEEGYRIWRKAFTEGRAGYFTEPVSNCLDYMEQALNQ
jgi:hypothetical protein